MRPLIALSTRPLAPGALARWPDVSAAAVPASYVESVWRAGGMESMVFPRPMTDAEADEYLARMDGLVLVGGGDVDPALYGEAPIPQVYGVDAASDGLELALVRAAVRRGLPTLCICRGMQILNVALGGTLEQHITVREDLLNHGRPSVGRALHAVDVEPASLLAKTQGGATRIEACDSFHHQAVGRLGAGLTVTARAEDGLVEAIELTDPKGWLVAVQWHPERTAEADPAQQALFNALIAAAAQS